jgi:hypothetical protein
MDLPQVDLRGRGAVTVSGLLFVPEEIDDRNHMILRVL